MFEIEYYKNKSGNVLFYEWYESLDFEMQRRVMAYLNRLKSSLSSKNIKSLGLGIFELKLSFGSGFRIYFSKFFPNKLVIFNAGDKSTQRKDILKAIEMRNAYAKNDLL